MEIFKFRILPENEIERREALKDSYNRCPHCGGHLCFQYETDYLNNKVTETKQCEDCGQFAANTAGKLQ